MEVIFRTRQLQRNYEDVTHAVTDWGHDVGHRYVERIGAILEAQNISHLYRTPALRLHPLRGSRSDKLSMYLIGRWRLIVTRGNTPQTIIIEEVSNHYDD